MKKYNFDVIEQDLAELLKNFVDNSAYNVIEHEGVLYLQDLDTPHKEFETTCIIDILDKALDMHIADIPNYSGSQQEHHIKTIDALKNYRCLLYGEYKR